MFLSLSWLAWVCRRSKKLAFKDDKAPFVLEIDDETDEDILAALQQKEPPPGTYFCCYCM